MQNIKAAACMHAAAFCVDLLYVLMHKALL